MKINVNAMKTLLKAKRVTVGDMKTAVKNGIITKEQYQEITGEAYV
jgi:hypothetical protein